MDAPITVMLVEDDAPTRRAFARALRGDHRFDLRAACATCREARAALAAEAPRALVTDLGLPDGHGLDLIRLARGLRPAPEILVVSVLGDERSVVEAIGEGACGYLLKDATAEALRRSVAELVAGESPISTRVARHVIRALQPRAAPARPGPGTQPLTQRESEILLAISRGFSYKEVACMLGMSHQTVPTHIKSIYRKLQVHSRSEAVFEAAQQGLIQIG